VGPNFVSSVLVYNSKMRSSQPFLLCSTLLLFFSTFTTAWSNIFPDLNALVVRQDNSQSNSITPTVSNTGSPTAPSSTNAGTTKPPSSSGSISGSASVTGSKSGSTSGTHSGSGSGSKTTTIAPSHTTFDARLPAGGISLLTPAAISGSQFFKVGDYVTFGFNFTSLSQTPTALDIFATCTANKNLYTIAVNSTVGQSTQAVTWDTQSTGTVPMVVATYTLIIFDADSSISAVPEAGYLAPFTSYAFGMYTPQSYSAAPTQFGCATCNAALSDMERQALGFVFAMSVATVLGFTWFVGGLGITL